MYHHSFCLNLKKFKFNDGFNQNVVISDDYSLYFKSTLYLIEYKTNTLTMYIINYKDMYTIINKLIMILNGYDC